MKIIVIAGPTASGKTAVAAELCKIIRGEIISADSRQVYRYLDVGTNKSGEWEEKRGVRVVDGAIQHLTDLVDPDEVFSAGDFMNLARKKIKDLKKSKIMPIVVGGTGLYIKALIDGLAPMPARNAEIRSKLEARLKAKGLRDLHSELESVDPVSAERNRHNPQRIIRALEVYELSGVPISRLQKGTVPSGESFIEFGLNWPREALYKRIEARSEEMLSAGIIEETKRVLEKGYSKNSEAFKSIGYSDVLDFLAGQIGMDELRESLKQDTRRYAKRQMTWFRADKRIRWINIDNSGFSPDKIAEYILKDKDNLI